MKPGVGLIGRKLGMTQIFRENGQPVSVTVLEAGPCTVVQAKTLERDGYRAVQLGFADASPKRILKPMAGHFAKAKIDPKQVLREFRLPTGQAGLPAGQAGIPPDQEYAVGSTVTAELFKVGDRIDVTGTSIGKGFQGGMKRWHWKGGPRTHGSMSHRRPGSIGSSTDPSRVFKGHHLPGHMGARRVTTEALEVVKVDPINHLVLVEGSVPGYDTSIILIRKSRKPPKLHGPAQQGKKKAAKLVPQAKAPAAQSKAAAPAAKK